MAMLTIAACCARARVQAYELVLDLVATSSIPVPVVQQYMCINRTDLVHVLRASGVGASGVYEMRRPLQKRSTGNRLAPSSKIPYFLQFCITAVLVPYRCNTGTRSEYRGVPLMSTTSTTE